MDPVKRDTSPIVEGFVRQCIRMHGRDRCTNKCKPDKPGRPRWYVCDRCHQEEWMHATEKENAR